MDASDFFRMMATQAEDKEKPFKTQKEAIKQLDAAMARMNVLKPGDYVILNEKESHNFKYPKKKKGQLGIVLEIGPWIADNNSTLDNVIVLVAMDKEHTRVFRMAEHLLEKVNVLKAVNE